MPEIKVKVSLQPTWVYIDVDRMPANEYERDKIVTEYLLDEPGEIVYDLFIE